MALTAEQINTITSDFTSEVVGLRGENLATGCQAIRRAAEDLESFIESNVVAINNALPEPFKSVATTPQKRRLLGLVVQEMSGI